MENVKFSVEDIKNIASFILPGYFAVRAYCLVHTKADKSAMRITIESITVSLVIGGLYNAIWTRLLKKPIHTTSVSYFIPLLLLSVIAGYALGHLRKHKPLSWVSRKLRLPNPNDDFIFNQFEKLPPNEYVTVTLRNGEVFYGIRRVVDSYRKGEPQHCYFNYISWFDPRRKKWDPRRGSLIINLNDVLYIETENPIPEE